MSDFAETWHGTADMPADLAPLRELLRSDQQLFVADTKRPFLYRCADPAAETRPTPAGNGAVRDEAGRLEQNAALALVDELLGPDSGIYRKGAERETWSLRLCFRFPDVARSRHAQALEAIAARSGWNVAVHPEPHLASLDDEQAALSNGRSISAARPGARHVGRLPEVDEVASVLGVNRLSVYRWAARGRIPVVRAGRRIRFALDEVIATLGRGKEEQVALQDAQQEGRLARPGAARRAARDASGKRRRDGGEDDADRVIRSQRRLLAARRA